MSARPRRSTVGRRARAAAAVAAVALLAACGAGGGEAEDGAESSAPAAEADAFPVTIEHALGTTEITEQPERVVTIGWGSQDTVLALGIVPVGVPADTWAGDPDTGLLPWTAEEVEELGGEAPTTFIDMPEVDVEEIALLAPDLVLATYSGITAEVYEQLSAIAPTVAYPDQPWLVSWQDQTVINGTALGRKADAEKLVEEMTDTIAAAAEANPTLEGKTFAYVYASPDGTLGAYVAGDPRVDLLTDLGMALAPSIDELEVPAGTFYVDLGTENTDLLADVDVLVTFFNDEAEQATVEGLGTFSSIPAVQRGSYVALLDRQLGMAMSTTTALSLPWGLEEFVPQLVTAAEAAE